MKTLLVIASAFILTATAHADQTTTEYIGDPILITAEVDNWETDPAFQLPVSAPTLLVEHRVALTKAFDAYNLANAELRKLLDALPFEASGEQMKSVDLARDQVAAAMLELVALESDFVQEKALFESDREEYAITHGVQGKIAAK